MLVLFSFLQLTSFSVSYWLYISSDKILSFCHKLQMLNNVSAKPFFTIIMIITVQFTGARHKVSQPFIPTTLKVYTIKYKICILQYRGGMYKRLKKLRDKPL